MKTPKKSARITLLMILQHIHLMEQRLVGMIMGGNRSLGERIDTLEMKVDHNHAQIMGQLDAIDKRLDDVEVVEIPKLKKVVGMR